MKQPHISRAGRKQQVWDMLNTLQRSYTMYEIADMLHMARSTHLNNILKEMVNDGVLVAVDAQHRPNMVKRFFRLKTDEEFVLVQTSMFDQYAA